MMTKTTKQANGKLLMSEVIQQMPENQHHYHQPQLPPDYPQEHPQVQSQKVLVRKWQGAETETERAFEI